MERFVEYEHCKIVYFSKFPKVPGSWEYLELGEGGGTENTTKLVEYENCKSVYFSKIPKAARNWGYLAGSRGEKVPVPLLFW